MKINNNYNMNKTQIRWSIEDAAAVKVNFKQKIKPNEPAVANHPTFGVAGGELCTGPPGRARSPGMEDILFPDHPPNNKAEPGASPFDRLRERLSFKREGPARLPARQGVSQNLISNFNTEYQKVIIYKTNFQFITNIKFLKIMKKQILILAFFVLAMIAGSLSSFGQLTTSNVLPVPGTCTSDALHPKGGIPYTYTVDNTNTVVPTDYSWWITKNPQFVVPVTGGADQTSKLVVGAGQLIATTALGAADGNSISITWTPEILAATEYQGTPNIAATAAAPSPTFVAVMANGTCTNNIQVYEIDPSPSFTVDITNIDPATATLSYGTDFPQCVDQVRGATYAASEVVMNYGTNTLYYEVISANFVTSWTPTFQIVTGSLNATQTADVIWYPTKADAIAGTNAIETVLAQADGATIAGTVALTSAIANTSVGVSVYVKVVVHNNKWETIADNPFTLAVDGVDNTNQWDLVNSDCTDPAAADQADTSTQTITRRPNILDNIGPGPLAPSFVPKN